MTMSELPAPLVALLGQISTNVILGAILAVVAAAAGAFGGTYLRKRGEDRAMSENFATIREQLRITTRDTEEIKQHLSGHAWQSQQQWSAREQYYGKLLTHLHHFNLALKDLSDHYLEPGTEYIPDSELSAHFHKLSADASSSYTEIQKLLGPAAIFLSSNAVDSLNHLFTEHWSLANFGAMCTADYVFGASKLAGTAYEQVLHEAKSQLGLAAAYPSLHPTCYSGLRPLPQAGELKR